MSDDNKSYWLVEGENAKAMLAQFYTERNKFIDAVEVFIEKHKLSSDYITSGRRIIGFRLAEGAVAAAWRKHPRESCYVIPNRRSRSGKAIVEELKAPELAVPDGRRMSELFLGCQIAFSDSAFHTAGLERIKDAHVVHARTCKDWKPIEGLKPLKPSEYFAMRGM